VSNGDRGLGESYHQGGPIGEDELFHLPARAQSSSVTGGKAWCLGGRLEPRVREVTAGSMRRVTVLGNIVEKRREGRV